MSNNYDLCTEHGPIPNSKINHKVPEISEFHAHFPMHLMTQVPLLRIMVLQPLHAWPILIQHVEWHPHLFYHHLLQGTKFRQCDPDLIKGGS